MNTVPHKHSLRFCSALVILTLFFLGSFQLTAQITPAEKTALQAIYIALDGDNWNSQNDADTTDDWDFTQPVTSDWYGVTVMSNNITQLELSQFNDQNNLSGNIPPEIGNFPSLTLLLLEYADLTGTSIPTEIGNLTSLTELKLGNNNLSGSIPSEIGNLVSLQNLYIDFNETMSGIIPIEIGSLTNLQRLGFAKNGLTGSIPTEITQLTQLIYLELDRNQLTGSIPLNIGNLTLLENFHIYENLISGSIPTSIGDLINLKKFWAEDNQLSGDLPLEIGSMSSLEQLILNDNAITGEIPSEFGNLIQLERLSLSDNQLDGNIPSELQGMTSLETLSLSDNQLIGNIPPELGNLSNLEALFLNDNQLTGSIPLELGNLQSIYSIFLNGNQLTGSIPTELGSLSTLGNLMLLDNQLSGSIPNSIQNLTNLRQFHIFNNNLSGAIPDLSGLPNLFWFSFSTNAFQFGDFENEFIAYDTNISVFDDNPQAKVDTEDIQDKIVGDNTTMSVNCSGSDNNYQWYKGSTAINDGGSYANTQTATLQINNIQLSDAGVYRCRVTSNIVTDLTIYRNDVTLNVTLPACTISTIEQNALLALYNSTNGANWTSETDGDTTNDWDVTNPIENWFGLTVDCDNSAVTRIDLNNNLLVGTIPSQIQDLSNLVDLRLYANQISGTIPVEIWLLTNLHTLELGNNQLNGSISTQIGNLTELANLTLYKNQLTGNLPTELGQLANLYQINVSNNLLDGVIPNQLTNLTELNRINLNGNNFSGVFPDFTYLPSIFWLAYQNNSFQFGDFENQFTWYQANASVFKYNPQAKVDAIETRDLNEGNNTTITTNCSGTQNNYQWFKGATPLTNGGNISGVNQSTLIVNNLQNTDAGVYHCEVTSDIVTGLIIERNEVTINVSSITLSPDDFVTTWKTDNPGTSNATSITIATTGTGYNYDVDWDNDGVFDDLNQTGNITHDYGTAGTYTIRIQGDFPRIYFNNAGDKDKIISIDQWGNQVWTSMAYAFQGCQNLAGQATDIPNLSSVSNASWMFYGCSIFNQDISNWDTQSVTNMSSMFRRALSFNSDITGWNVTGVTDMDHMFDTASVFNQPIGAWTTSSLSEMESMFEDAIAFNQNIGSWDVSGVDNMNWVFSGATMFNQSLSNWDTSGVTSMQGMFENAGDFNQDLSSFDTALVEHMNDMFSGASSFNGNVDNWNVTQVTTTGSMFKDATAFDRPIGGWIFSSSLARTSSMFNGATNFNQDLSNWSVGSVIYMGSMFKDAVTFNQDISNWDVNLVTDMSSMFDGASVFNQPIGSWETQNVSSMYSMFKDASVFDQNLANWNVESLITGGFNGAANMFQNVTLSTVNYDALLISWSSQTLNSDIIFNGGNSKYCTAETERQSIINDFNWTITDGGKECLSTTPDCPVVTSPIDTDIDVALSPSITWDAALGATAYRITIGTTSGGAEVEDTTLGDVTSYTPIASLAENTLYYVTVYATNGSLESSGCTEVSFTTESDTIARNEIPNFFTPNNDGHNDDWQVIDEDGLIKQIQIIDRYGKVLKQFTTDSRGWNGNYLGKPMPNDDYWYIITYNSGEKKQGHFSLIRR